MNMFSWNSNYLTFPTKTDDVAKENEMCIVHMGEDKNRQKMIGIYAGRDDQNIMTILVNDRECNKQENPPPPPRIGVKQSRESHEEQKPITSNSLSIFLDLSSTVTFDDYYLQSQQQEEKITYSKKEDVIKVGDLVSYNNENKMRGIVTHIESGE